MRWTCVLVLVSLAAAPAGEAATQRVNGAVEGRVMDESGMPVPDVTVSAQNRATGVHRETTTGRDGRFVLAGLPVEGEYGISMERAGFAPVLREGIVLVADETVAIDVTLRVTASETVAVPSAAPTLAQRSDVRQTINETLVRSLPLADRRFLQLASLAAGFTGHPDHPSPQGQQYWTHNVLVDGASHFSKWRSAARAFYSGYGLESIKDVQVFTNRFTAEFGQALASVTSATTKAGTNQWHGSALLFARDGALDAAPAFAAGTAPARGQQYGFSLGGPIVVDRTHLFSSYEGRRTRDRNVVVSPAAPNAQVADNQDEHLVLARIDHRRGGQVFTARYNGQRFRWHEESGGLSLPGTGTGYTNDVQTALVTHTTPISTRMLNDLRLQFARYVDVRRDLQPTVFLSRAGHSQEGGLLGPAGFGTNPEDTWEAVDTFSHWVGRHALRIGGGVTHVRAHAMAWPYGRGAYFFAGSPEAHPEPFLFVQGLASGTAATTADPRSLAASAFIQDDWRIRSRLTLNLGVRYDVEDVFDLVGYDVRADRNNVQPRVGLSWDPGGAGRTVIRGGVGVYMQQQLLYPINRVQLEGPGGVAIVSVPAGSPAMPRFPATLSAAAGPLLPPRDIVRADPALRNPYSVQATVGIERLLLGTTLGVDYVHLRGRDLVSLVDANAPSSVLKPAQRTVAQADATRPIVPAATTYRKIITLANEGESWYRALQVKMERTAGRWQGVGSYTLARAEDMADAELPEDSRNVAAEKGRAATDLTHNLSSGLTWELPEWSRAMRGWSLSALGTYRSGRPYTVSWGDDRNGTTQNDARPGGRNTRRGGAFRSLDLAVTKRFQRRVVADARVEAFNVLNTTNYDRYVGALLSPLFGRPVSAFPRRRLQLAVVVRF